MANLPETSTWESGIYQIEETDVVRGGPVADGGISNKQSQQLGNRTKYLYDHLGIKGGIIVDTISANISIDSADLLDKHHVLSISLTGANVTINASGLPDGALLSFSAISNEDYKSVNLIPQSGMQFIGVPGALSNVNLPIYAKEAISLIKNGTDLIIIGCKMQLDEVGEIIYKAKAPLHALAAQGQLLGRSAYPRLWKYASGLSDLVSDTNWLQNGLKYIGCFSTGNGTTTFRMPDLRGLFLRGLGNDYDRLYSGEGGGQADEFKKHKHTVLFIERPNSETGNPGYDGGSNKYDKNYDEDTSEVGGIETRPKNVAFTAYIKY